MICAHLICIHKICLMMWLHFHCDYLIIYTSPSYDIIHRSYAHTRFSLYTYYQIHMNYFPHIQTYTQKVGIKRRLSKGDGSIASNTKVGWTSTYLCFAWTFSWGRVLLFDIGLGGGWWDGKELFVWLFFTLFLFWWSYSNSHSWLVPYWLVSIYIHSLIT